MPAAQADLRDMHLHQVFAIAVPAPFMKAAAARPFGAVEDALDLRDRLRREVVQLEVETGPFGEWSSL